MSDRYKLHTFGYCHVETLIDSTCTPIVRGTKFQYWLWSSLKMFKKNWQVFSAYSARNCVLET